MTNTTLKEFYQANSAELLIQQLVTDKPLDVTNMHLHEHLGHLVDNARTQPNHAVIKTLGAEVIVRCLQAEDPETVKKMIDFLCRVIENTIDNPSLTPTNKRDISKCMLEVFKKQVFNDEAILRPENEPGNVKPFVVERLSNEINYFVWQIDRTYFRAQPIGSSRKRSDLRLVIG